MPCLVVGPDSMSPDDGTPKSDGVPSGAVMDPIYMGRKMTTYPVSEPEMESISMLNTQTTVRFAVATLLFGLAASIWTNSIFNAALTPEARIATYYVAPLLFFF